MTNPNNHPAPTMVYGGAPSFDGAPAPNPFADLRAGLDAAKRLREHLPGESPELQQADDTIAALEAAIDAAGPSPSTTADLAERMALADELATLRADNDARGVLIEQLRAERDQLRTGIVADSRRNEDLAAELDTVRSERDAVREELTDVLIELDRVRMELAQARRDRDKYFSAYQRTLRALNAALGEP